MTIVDSYYPYGTGATEVIQVGNKDVINHLHYNNGVVAGAYGNKSLRVESNATQGVWVNPGKALLWGYVYDLNQRTALNLDSTAANNRYDAIVIKHDTGILTLEVVKGTENANPKYPTLTNTITVGYLVLSYVFLAHPYVGTDPATAEYIQDHRVMIETPRSILAKNADRVNLVPNAELAVYSSASGTATADLPEGWIVDTGALIITRDSSYNSTPRGYNCSFRADTGATCSCAFIAPRPNGFELTAYGDSVPITAYVHFTATTNKRLRIRLQQQTLGGVWTNLADTVYTYYASTSSWFGAILRAEVFTSSVITNNTLLRVQIEDITPAVATDILFSYVSVCYGYVPISFERQSEIIFLKNPITAYFDGTFRVSTGRVTVTEAITAGIAHDVRFLLLDVLLRDSGSAAGTALLEFEALDPYYFTLATIQCSGMPNDHYVRQQIWLPVRSSASTNRFYITATATGALTLDATVTIVGVIT
jgi:hypothetical protein